MKEKEAPERFSLSRWSRRKLESKTESAVPIAAPASTPAAAPQSSAATSSAAMPAPELPSVDSLTFDSDFSAFLRPEVDDKLKRAALKQLFRDPRFNVMDGLDVYIDDYTKADPIPPDLLKDMLQRGFGAVASASPSSTEPPGSTAESAQVVPAPAAPQPLPPTATTSAASSSESQSPESAPDPKAAPQSPL